MDLVTRAATALGIARAVTNPVDPSMSLVSPAVIPPSRDGLPGTVTPREAAGLDAVFRAFLVLQTAVMQLTLDVWQRGTLLTDLGRFAFIRQPDLTDHLPGFLSRTVVDLAARGNAYWRVTRNTEGYVVELTPLNPLLVVGPVRTDTGTTVYRYKGTTIPARDVQHLRLLRDPDGTLGLGPIQACARRLSGALAQAAYADTWFDQSGVPGGTLTTDQALTAEQATQWRDQWHESVKGRRTAVLGSGLQYAPIHLTPEEAQWIEGQRFSVTAVARMFGIPPRLILAAVDGSSSTYSNLQQDDLSFVRWTLMAYLREIEAGLSQLLPRGVDARFNLDALLRPDTTTRYAAHRSGLDGGFLTVDEVRATEGLPPLHTTPTSEVTP